MILDGLRGLVRTATVEIVLVWGCGPIANSISEADWDEAALVNPQREIGNPSWSGPPVPLSVAPGSMVRIH